MSRPGSAMGRQQSIARSIVVALKHDSEEPGSRRTRSRALAVALAFVALYQLPLSKVQPTAFRKLRSDHWHISEDEYLESFSSDDTGAAGEALHGIGHMGYSGSTFFDTQDKRFLIKSVPRWFEHSFFRDDVLDPYVSYVATHPRSLLVRIYDFLASPYYPIGSLLNLAPTHHIVMENILYRNDAGVTETATNDWEEYDLKPQSYFFPERDIANGMLASEATKSRLADEFNDKIVLDAEQAHEFAMLLEQDTQILASQNAVDYSLFLIRAPLSRTGENPFADSQEELGVATPSQSGETSKEPPVNVSSNMSPMAPALSWREGVRSADGRFLYRAAILDFFWAKHKTRPKVMTGLIKLWNQVISQHGHMSITTSPEEYRERFLKMCTDIVEVRTEAGGAM